MVSVIIACYNDQGWLDKTMARLYHEQDLNSFEAIVVDDGSTTPITAEGFPVRVLRNTIHQGVGYCFDRGVKEAVGDTIILMGSDVLVKDRSWLSEAEKWSVEHPEAMGCAVSYCFTPSVLEFNEETKRTYGANISWVYTFEKHPFNNPIIPAEFGLDVVNASSVLKPIFDNDTIIPCLIGAFYVTTKAWYQKIYGWDTDGPQNRGHKNWGGLEPWISIKTWLAGGEVHYIPQIEVGHVYGRIGNVLLHRGVRADLRWYNKLFIIHTLFTEAEKQGVLSMIERLYKENGAYDRNYGQAKKLIKENKEFVDTVTARNDQLFSYESGSRSLNIFTHKFRTRTPWEK